MNTGGGFKDFHERKIYERFMSVKNAAAVKFMSVHEKVVLGKVQHANLHIHECVA